MGKRRVPGKKPLRMTPQIIVTIMEMATMEPSKLNYLETIEYLACMSVSWSIRAKTIKNMHMKATRKRILSKTKLNTFVV